MKKLEDIEKEYEGYTTDKPYITNLMEFFCYIEIGLDSLVEDQDVAVKERRSLKGDRFMLKLMDTLTFASPEEDSDVHFLDADIAAVDKVIQLSNNQATYFARIAECASEANFRELLRLMDFACEYYNQNIDYIDYLRDVYEFQRKGINMFNCSKEDYMGLFDQFMQKKLAEFEKAKEKPVEKVKK